ncbi:TetR/AcrR family transcriptional regulator [Actinomadura alba]|uniref:TetR/AcrR family transcriptional regulator n=1 Tax=Actinomadura alba TaxID=406431 RepID=A0ABR7LQW0_9ACTN|nr:TetR/AcrR family transcriptional regulator [Actinomadura alba]MBC6466887.1 TetR/AcrR family transcriptional regulator [Actinomadura alba]
MTARQPTSVWTRPPRARKEQPTLSQGQIVTAAVELLDADGLERLSMRRLGTRLGSGATSLYWHIATKDELLELALDHVMAEVTVPDPAPSDWRVAATGFARELRAMILRHPWTLPLFGSRPMLGPNAARQLDEVLGVFQHAGFTGFELEYAHSAVIDHVIGTATGETSWHRHQPGVGAVDWMASMGPYLERIGGDHPRLAAHVQEIWAQNERDVLEERFTFGLDAVLDGLASRLPRA